ncbi:hypothetical protein [Rhizobium leguminosarum]|nr:hypothetical protein [Rhizobium leguminosarum]MDI5924897.1 hypothetical protein [Rhizobium leguminosarum]
MKPLVGRVPDQRHDEVAPLTLPAENVALVVTPLPATEVGTIYTTL